MPAGLRRQGGQRMQWIDDLSDWSGKSLSELERLAKARTSRRTVLEKRQIWQLHNT